MWWTWLAGLFPNLTLQLLCSWKHWTRLSSSSLITTPWPSASLHTSIRVRFYCKIFSLPPIPWRKPDFLVRWYPSPFQRSRGQSMRVWRKRISRRVRELPSKHLGENYNLYPEIKWDGYLSIPGLSELTCRHSSGHFRSRPLTIQGLITDLLSFIHQHFEGF